MTIEEQIHAAMGRWLSEKLEKTVEVTSYYEDYRSNYYGCGTCDFSSYEVTMFYKDSGGGYGHFDYKDGLSALIRELT